jgi:hypothetical protein
VHAAVKADESACNPEAWQTYKLIQESYDWGLTA